MKKCMQQTYKNGTVENVTLFHGSFCAKKRAVTQKSPYHFIYGDWVILRLGIHIKI